MKLLKEKIEYYLTKYPDLQDSDTKLIATVWLHQSKGVEDKYNFLKLFSQGKVSNPESITRSRRKVQELNPKLRGKNYLKRQKEQQNVKKQLKNFIN